MFKIEDLTIYYIFTNYPIVQEYLIQGYKYVDFSFLHSEDREERLKNQKTVEHLINVLLVCDYVFVAAVGL